MPRKIEIIMEVGESQKYKGCFFAHALDAQGKHGSIIGYGDTEDRAIGQCFDAVMRAKREAGIKAVQA